MLFCSGHTRQNINYTKAAELLRQGYTVPQVSNELGIKKHTLYQFMKRQGLSVNRARSEQKTVVLLSVETAICPYCEKERNISSFNKGNSRCSSCRSNLAVRSRRSLNGKLKTLIRNAKRRQNEISISYEYLDSLYQLQKGKCFYTDIPLVYDSIGYSEKSMSLDRIQFNGGYTEGNVVLASWIANKTKSNLSLDEMKLYLNPEWHRRATLFLEQGMDYFNNENH